MESFLRNTNRKKVNRIAVAEGIEKLLGVPMCQTGQGVEEANAVYKTLESWNLIDRVKAMCFDTTGSNTGPNIGTCTTLESLLGRDLYSLACRHHIRELTASAVFK